MTMRSNLIDRTVENNNTQISFQLEWKNVKNFNLRIRKDGSVYVSANEQWGLDAVDGFILKKAEYILTSKKYFSEIGSYLGKPKQYVTDRKSVV